MEEILLKAMDDLNKKVDKLDGKMDKMDDKIDEHGKIIALGTGDVKMASWIIPLTITGFLGIFGYLHYTLNHQQDHEQSLAHTEQRELSLTSK